MSHGQPLWSAERERVVAFYERQLALFRSLQSEHGIHGVANDAAHGAARSRDFVIVTFPPSLTAVTLP